MHHHRFPSDPFSPFASLPAAKMVRDLLISDAVQAIRFAFGSIPVWPEGFRSVADHVALSANVPGMKVVIDANYFIGRLRAEKPILAEYELSTDEMKLPSHALLEGDIGRGIVVHECVHALCDLRARSTAIRSEEGAASVAQAWYYLERGATDIPRFALNPVFLEIAGAARERAAHTAGIVALKGSEINSARAQMAREGFENDFYRVNDGIAGIG